MLEIARRRDQLAEHVRQAQPRSLDTLEEVLEDLHREQPRLLAHVRRVASAAVTIAHALPLPELACQHVRRAALVHDIGKLAFPSSLIDKDGQFTSEELAVIRTHTVAGAAILINVPYLQATAAVVAATHERWAGGGFPRGLFNDAIPMPSRIIAVADAFDALSGHVADADPDVRDAANAELVRYAGSHFDPAVVRAWLRAPELAGC
jgi:putative two-component system response regulator